MAKHRGIVEEVLTPLLRQLAVAHRLLRKSTSTSEIDHLLDKINRDVQHLRSTFQQSESKEREVIDCFDAVYQHVDDLLQCPKLHVRSARQVPDEMPQRVESRAGMEERSISADSPSTFMIGETSEPRPRDPTIPEVAENPTIPEGAEIQTVLEAIDQEITKIKENLPCTQPASEESAPAPVEDRATPDKWQETQWERMFRESESISLLRSRIENLDNQLKGCLFTFTAFPEGVVIKKRLMIHWWIGEGLIVPSDERTAEQNGELVIGELISMRLIEASYRRWSLEVVGCKMFQWIYRLLILSPTGRTYFSPSHRMCLSEANRELKSVVSDLSTLYNISNRYLMCDKELFTGKKSLRVIQLSRWQDLPKYHIEVDSTDFLHGLKQCTKLKYLSLRGISRIAELPDSIGRLTNLIILDLRACHNLEKLTGAITSLKNLTHLDVSECYLLEQMPKGLGSLSKLQVLKGFVIGTARSQKRRSTDPCSLTELAKLENLRKLSISMGRNSILLDDESRVLEKFSALKSLMIRWGVVVPPSTENSPANVQGKTLQRIQTLVKKTISLPPQLEKLDLRSFPGKEFLDCISPEKRASLKKLYIRGGQLRSLRNDIEGNVEVLRLKCLNHLVLEWKEVHNAFPHLSCLEVCKCAKIESFPCDEEGVWMKENTSSSTRNII